MNTYEQIGEEVRIRIDRYMATHFNTWRHPRVVVHVDYIRWKELMRSLPPYEAPPLHRRPWKLWGGCTVIPKDLNQRPRDWYIRLTAR